MRVAGHAEQVVRLDHLQALVHQRGRIDRDLAAPSTIRDGRPACSGVTVARARRGCGRGTARPRRSARCARTPRRCGVARAAAGTGRSRCARCRSARSSRRRRARRAISSAPASTSDSLLASSRRLPARAAASVDGRPAAPTIAATTVSQASPATSASSASSPACAWVARPASRRPSRSAANSDVVGDHRVARAVRAAQREQRLDVACRRPARWRASGRDGARSRPARERRSSRWRRVPRSRAWRMVLPSTSSEAQQCLAEREHRQARRARCRCGRGCRRGPGSGGPNP